MIRWSPYRNLLHVNREMENLFEDFFGTARRGNEEKALTATWAPDVDLSENKEGYTLRAEVPGVSKEEVKVTLTDDVLTVSGEKKYEKEVKEESFHRSERAYGVFSRSFKLPGSIQADKIKAEYRDGVLTLSIPKAESLKPKEITIQ
jgi:HSP20 family protein